MVTINTVIHFASTSTKALASSGGLIKHLGMRILASNTLIKKIIFLIYKEIQMGLVAKSYMRMGFVIYEEIRKNLVMYEGRGHGRMNYKDTKPYMSAFLSVDLLTDFAAFCLTDFIDWRYIHS
jgi:hypothetical protein